MRSTHLGAYYWLSASGYIDTVAPPLSGKRRFIRVQVSVRFPLMAIELEKETDHASIRLAAKRRRNRLPALHFNKSRGSRKAMTLEVYDRSNSMMRPPHLRSESLSAVAASLLRHGRNDSVGSELSPRNSIRRQGSNTSEQIQPPASSKVPFASTMLNNVF